MAVGVLSPWTVTLAGIPLSVVPDPTRTQQATATIGPGYSGSFETQESTRAIAKRDVPEYIRRFDRGCGLAEMRDAQDAGGYAWAEDMMMWLGNGAIPSGRRTATGSGYGIGAVGAVIDSAVWQGSLIAITSAKQGLQWANVNPVGVPTFTPALNSFGDATASFRTGYNPKAIVLFQTTINPATGDYLAGGTKVPCIVISTYNAGTGATRIYWYTTVSGWREGAADLGYRADSMVVVWWEGRDGVGAYRLLIQTDDTTVHHCIDGSDPSLGASYVTPIQVAEPGYVITKLAGAPGHAYAVTTGGIMDFNEIRVWNLTPYWKESSAQSLRSAATIYDDHIYAARGFGLDRYDLRLDGAQQRIPGECAPMAFMQDGTPIRGSITALTQHDGWLLAAVYNPEIGKSYVMRAKDRRSLGIEVANPMVWHGAEQVLTADTIILHMRVTPNTAAGTYFTQTSMLWMFAADSYATISTSNLYYAPLPSGSGALSLQLSGGTFTYNATGRIYHTALTWDDRNALKPVRRADLVNRNTTATATIALKARVDADPTTITDQSTWTTLGTATSNSASITPASPLSGRSIALQSVLTTPSPYTAPPILHEISPRAAVRRETFKVRYLWAVLEKDYEMADGQPDIRDPDTTFDSVTPLQNQGPVAFVSEQNGSESVLVEQNITFARGEIEETGQWRTLMRLELSKVS